MSKVITRIKSAYINHAIFNTDHWHAMDASDGRMFWTILLDQHLPAGLLERQIAPASRSIDAITSSDRDPRIAGTTLRALDERPAGLQGI